MITWVTTFNFCLIGYQIKSKLHIFYLLVNRSAIRILTVLAYKEVIREVQCYICNIIYAPNSNYQKAYA